MQVVLFGATGMVGHGVLTALLEDPSVEGVPFHPLIRRLYPGRVTTTDAIAYTTLEVLHAPETVPRKLDNPAINEHATRGIKRVTPA